MNETWSRSVFRNSRLSAMRALSLVVASFLAAGNMQLGHAAMLVKHSALVTTDQIAVESLALKILASPEVKKQKKESRKLLQALPAAATADGRRTMQRTLDELTYLGALTAANNSDPAHPKATWAVNAPYTSFGKKIPGSGGGFDNPDQVYQLITVDSASRYEISFHAKQPVPKMFVINLYDNIFGGSGKRNFDAALGGYNQSNLKTEADGSFKITADSDPANGRENHIQIPADGHCILIRNMLDDWSRQNPFEVVVRRIAGPELAIRGDRELAQNAASALKDVTDLIVEMLKAGFGSLSQPNTVSKPFARGGGWSYVARGKYKLADDEALLVTVTTPPNRYMSVQLSDPWLHSVEYVRANGSLNTGQAEPNSDGSYTYVISARDPGIQNWLDTNGLHEGEFLFRWQALSDNTVAGEIREAKLVKLAELPALLPPATTKVTPEQRKALYLLRAKTYAHRYLPE